jgi:hypothetical protein
MLSPNPGAKISFCGKIQRENRFPNNVETHKQIHNNINFSVCQVSMSSQMTWLIIHTGVETAPHKPFVYLTVVSVSAVRSNTAHEIVPYSFPCSPKQSLELYYRLHTAIICHNHQEKKHAHPVHCQCQIQNLINFLLIWFITHHSWLLFANTCLGCYIETAWCVFIEQGGMYGRSIRINIIISFMESRAKFKS